MDSIRVIIADDHPLFREGVVKTLAAADGVDVIAEGATAQDAINLTARHLPDIVLIDISMEGNGIDAARHIAAEHPDTGIIMLTVSEQPDDITESLQAGARAFVLKGTAARELVRIIRDVHDGQSYMPPALAANLLRESRQASPNQNPAFDTLTERESEVLKLLATGLKNVEIAERLALSEKTVKHYITNILQKLNVRNRVEAALLARDALDHD